MSDIISYEELRRVQHAEIDNKELQLLDGPFFNKVKEYITTKQKMLTENKDSDNAFSKVSVEQTEKELHNINNILTDICSRRNKKIVLQALTNLNTRIHDTEKMLPFEERFYNDTIKMLKENIKEFMSEFEKNAEEPKRTEMLSVRPVQFLEPVPSFLWNDGITYGPYNKEDIANLPLQIGEILIKEKKAIEFIANED